MPTPLLVAGAALSIGGSIFKGMSAYSAAKEQGESILGQGRIQYYEALRDASIIEEEGERFAEEQALQFIGSGVELGGSALITLRQTKAYAENEANAVRIRGVNVMRSAEKSAKTVRKQGRAELISSFFGAGKSALDIFSPQK